MQVNLYVKKTFPMINFGSSDEARHQVKELWERINGWRGLTLIKIWCGFFEKYTV